jgi:predicted glycosyltransferase
MSNTLGRLKMTREASKKIWIDLDNSPHVPFFVPIIRELQRAGHSTVLTARDCFQVCGLADRHGLHYTKIGRHYGASKLLKIFGTLWRTIQLAPIIVRERPALSLSHGSRPLVLLSRVLGVPTILMFDYEHARTLPFLTPDMGLAPEAIGNVTVGKQFKTGLRLYQGLKEDVYAGSFKPNADILRELGLRGTEVVATIRPPATEAHYHNRESETLFVEVINFLASIDDLKMVILPRNEKTQREFVLKTWPSLCREGRILIPDGVVDGLNLIWHSDFVVSGGGTMNREAAALGVPVYSIFRGRLGAVDRYLADHGRLTLIEAPEEVRVKIQPIRRVRSAASGGDDNPAALRQILRATEELLAAHS